MFWLICTLAIIIGTLIHIYVTKTHSTTRRLEIFLLYLFGIGVGFEGIMGFIAHTFMADQTARQIGWQPGSPFQFEVAIANLAFGVLGLLCLWLRGNAWWATAIGVSVFLLGDAYGHIIQIIVNQNYAPDNAGAVLYNDILLPIVLLATLTAYTFSKQHEEAYQLDTRASTI